MCITACIMIIFPSMTIRQKSNIISADRRCGPPPMLDAIIRMLDGIGVEPNMIAFDKF